MALTQGIDVSRWQPSVDWARVQAAGIAFACIKASQSNFADPMFAKHWAGARQVGLPRGAYHFLVQETDGLKQATTFLKTLGDDPGELPPVIDIEDTKMTSPVQYTKIAEACLAEVEKQLGRRPIIYTAAWYWGRMVVGGKPPAWAPEYPLWVASYPLKDGFPSLGEIEQGKYKPIMPKSWSAWAMWQYSERGRVDGVANSGKPANVDLNAFQGTLDDLLAMAGGAPAPGGNGAAPAPPVDASRATNIQMLNAFVRAFGNQAGQLLQGTGLMSSLTARPVDRYTGPAIASLPNLSEAQKAALNTALAQILSEG